MPIEKAMILDTGVNLPAAYIKIIRINFSYQEPFSVEIIVSLHKDQASYSVSKLALEMRRHVCSGAGFDTYFLESVLNGLDKNHLSQAYAWLSTLDEYSS
jgi:hypothetical protein